MMKLLPASLMLLFSIPALSVALNLTSAHPDPSMEDFYWVKSSANQPLPQFAVQGGHEANGRPLFICQAKHQGGIHPGKLVAGNCNIAWGGAEIIKTKYKVLVSTTPETLAWRRAGHGYIPERAIPGGYENGHPLFICKAKYLGAAYPGKIVGENCNISYAGKEVPVTAYRALVA